MKDDTKQAMDLGSFSLTEPPTLNALRSTTDGALGCLQNNSTVKCQ